MATVQFHGENFSRCKLYCVSKTWLEFATYEHFATTILEAIGTFFEGKVVAMCFRKNSTVLVVGDYVATCDWCG